LHKPPSQLKFEEVDAPLTVAFLEKMLIGFSKGFRLLWSVPMIPFDIRNLLKVTLT